MAINGNQLRSKNGLDWEKQYFKKGQKVLYEGKDAQIIKVKPFLVMKTADRIV